MAVAAATAMVLVAPVRVLFPDCGGHRGPLAPEPVVLRVLAASQKAPFVADLFRRQFEGTRPHVDSRCIKVDVRDKPSGEPTEALIHSWSAADGESFRRTATPSAAPEAVTSDEPWSPDVWYPSASVWVDQVRDRSREAIIPKEPSPSLGATPQVVAMPRRMAEALD